MGQTPLITDLLHHSVCTQSILLQADTDNLQIFLLLPVQQMIEKNLDRFYIWDVGWSVGKLFSQLQHWGLWDVHSIQSFSGDGKLIKNSEMLKY